jgi:sialate O-acetylesterase
MATCYAFDALDIHPKNKKDVGERLARIALAKDYGTDVVYSGPDYSGITFENGKAIISFKHPEGGLVANAVPETYVLSLPKSSGSLGPQ